MIRKKQPDQIKYFELDERINISNFKSLAIKAPFKKEYIEILIGRFFHFFPGLIKEVDTLTYSNLTKDELEYYGHLWIERGFYTLIYNKLDGTGVILNAGTISLFLLILKHIEKQFNIIFPELSQNAPGFLSFFVWQLIQARLGSTPNIAICYRENGFFIPLPHQEYLLEKILDWVDAKLGQEDSDLRNILWGDTLPITPAKIKKNKKQIMATLRRMAIGNLNLVLEKSKLKHGEKMVLLNDLLAEVKFMDYKPVRTSFGKTVKSDRNKIIDKIENQIKQL